MSRTVVFFCMRGAGHFGRLRALVRGLVRRGADVHVFTERVFARDVEADGARFVDLFGLYPAVDTVSTPRPVRDVTFAGTHAADVARDVERLGASLIVYDTFAVIGYVVGRLLGIPYVNVCAGHNLEPLRVTAGLGRAWRLNVTKASLNAVEVLRERFGVEGASPFLYVATQSPFLNVYCEPPEFLSEPERAPFQPIEFFGSLPGAPEPPGRELALPGAHCERLVYVSFGTIVWRPYGESAATALAAVVSGLAGARGARVVVSRGGASLPAETEAALIHPNVTVHDYVDQHRILREADVFVTHHGLNSTHEAIGAGVPMISCPFFWDQPALAAKCQELGLALPLGSNDRAVGAFEPYPAPQDLPSVTSADAAAAFAAFSERRDVMRARLERARQWEVAIVERRPVVIDRILRLS